MAPAPRDSNPLGLLRRSLVLPLDHVSLDLPQHCAKFAPVEVFDDPVRVVVVVQRLARREIEPAPTRPSDAGICRFDYPRDVSIVAIHISLNQADGGGGNRTRVRGRTGQSVYKLRLPLRFARRPVGSRPTSGLAILWCRTSGDWLSVGAEPVF